MRCISREQHREIVGEQGTSSLMQHPDWGAAVESQEETSSRRAESVGWFDAEGKAHAAALVMYHQIPVLNRRLAYLPEGPHFPVTTGTSDDLAALLNPLVDYARRQKAFAVRINPMIALRVWQPSTVAPVLATDPPTPLNRIEPDERVDAGFRMVDRLRADGWLAPGTGIGRDQVLLELELTGKTPQQVRSGFNQGYKSAINRALRAGVEVGKGPEALSEFYDLYVTTAARRGFDPRPRSYFERLLSGSSGAEGVVQLQLFVARHEGEALAAAVWARCAGRVWYYFGASSGQKRELQAPTLLQWEMIQEAIALGADIYDMRVGPPETTGDDVYHIFRFLFGSRGRVTQYVGQWDYPINRVLYYGFRLALRNPVVQRLSLRRRDN